MINIFTMTIPIINLFEQELSYTKEPSPIQVGEPPCTRPNVCPYYSRCKTNNLACPAFVWYAGQETSKIPYKQRKRVPSEYWYNVLFNNPQWDDNRSSAKQVSVSPDRRQPSEYI